MSGSDRNSWWPDRMWLHGNTYAKRRTTHSEEGAVEYVRADVYDDLLNWANAMIMEGEVCPCSKPEGPEPRP